MIPNRDFVNPFNDNRLTYSFDTNSYYLTPSYAKKAVGDDGIATKIGGDDNLEWIMQHMSKVAYEVIRNYMDSKYYDKLGYYLSHSKLNREVIFKILVDILIYTEQDGGLYTAYATAINFNEMKAFDMTLDNYIGRMARQIIVNGGLAQRIVLWDLDRLTTTHNSKYDLLIYMDSKDYVDIEDYYNRITLLSDGGDFDADKYNEIRDLINKEKFVAIKSPITFTIDEVRQFVDLNTFPSYIRFLFEQNNYIDLENIGNINGSPIQDVSFYLDFELTNGQPLIPKSNKYFIQVDSNGYYLLHEFGHWEIELSKKGVEW